MPKILIVEDDADIAAIERDYLELSGYEVTICSDGTSGLNAALTENCDLLLLDLMLPGTDGFTICRAVREKKDIAYLTRFCNIFSVLHKGRILTDALLNEPPCINKRKSRGNAEKYSMPQNRKRKFQKGE